jgi:hypothetical protein
MASFTTSTTHAGSTDTTGDVMMVDPIKDDTQTISAGEQNKMTRRRWHRLGIGSTAPSGIAKSRGGAWNTGALAPRPPRFIPGLALSGGEGIGTRYCRTVKMWVRIGSAILQVHLKAKCGRSGISGVTWTGLLSPRLAR